MSEWIRDPGHVFMDPGSWKCLYGSGIPEMSLWIRDPGNVFMDPDPGKIQVHLFKKPSIKKIEITQ